MTDRLNSELYKSLEEYERAIRSLEISIELFNKSVMDNKQEIELHKALRDSCIQRFEFSVEQSWKVAMRVLALDVRAPNPAVREMARNNLIDNPDAWFEFLIARNKTSHTYAEDVAREVFTTALKAVPHFHNLLQRLKDILKS
jgi:nucleotidyltransferase substrate binding protein (TIGR01987 family)